MLCAADDIIRWEYAFVYRAGLSDQTGSLELGFRNKTDDFAHGGLQGWKNIPSTPGCKSSELEDPLPSQELISGWVAPCEKPTSFRGHRRKKSVSWGVVSDVGGARPRAPGPMVSDDRVLTGRYWQTACDGCVSSSASRLLMCRTKPLGARK
jgi:hypothetical protein